MVQTTLILILALGLQKNVIFVNMIKLLILLFLTACIGSNPSDGWYGAPGGRVFSFMPPGGSDAYQKGWMEGCESGMSIYSHALQKAFYSFKKDIRFTTDYKYGDERDL